MNAELAQQRCGYVTASAFKHVLAKGQGKTRADYLRRVVTERITGIPCETFSNRHTDRGQDQEPHAKLAYEVLTGELIIPASFITHPTLRAGCTPDGLLGEDGGLEAKSVIPTVQLDTWLGGDYPTEHRAQVQGNLWLSKRAWWEFISFSKDMPEHAKHLRLYRFRVRRDDDYIANLAREVAAFDAEADKLYNRLMQINVPLEDLLRQSLEKVAA